MLAIANAIAGIVVRKRQQVCCQIKTMLPTRLLECHSCWRHLKTYEKSYELAMQLMKSQQSY